MSSASDPKDAVRTDRPGVEFYGLSGADALNKMTRLAGRLAPSGSEVTTLIEKYGIPPATRIGSFFGVIPRSVMNLEGVEDFERRITALGYDAEELLESMGRLVSTQEFIRYAPRDTFPLRGNARDVYIALREGDGCENVQVLGVGHTRTSLECAREHMKKSGMGASEFRKSVMEMYNLGYAGLDGRYRVGRNGRMALATEPGCCVYTRLDSVDAVSEAESISRERDSVLFRGALLKRPKT
jgi:hypothetical protein